MPVPTYEQLIGPLLLFLAEQDEPVKPAEAYERLAEVVGISEEDKRELVPSGIQPIYKNRIGWAQDALKRNHLSSSPKWGRWQITDEGKEFVKRHGGVVPDEEAHQIALRNRNKPLAEILGASAPEDVSERAQPDEEGVQSPEDKIDEGLEEIRASVARELLELVLRGSPEFFEQLVLDLLHAMGYGANRKALQRVGGAGDGGIDGIISLDRLGLEKVYVLALLGCRPIRSRPIKIATGGTVFCATLLAIWRLEGRPEGIEQRLRQIWSR